MTKLRYADMSKAEIDFLSNGCGASWSVKAPKWLFKKSCDQHDVNYWLGYTEADRKKADDQFWASMRAEISKFKFYLKPIRWIEAKIFYHLVKKFGFFSFYYGEKERTREDLEMLMYEDSL